MQRYEGFVRWSDTSGRADFDPSRSGAVLTQWLEALYESHVLFSGLLDRGGHLVEANRLAIEGCGFVRSETLGRPFWDCGWWSGDPALAATVEGWCKEAVRSGRSLRAVCRYFRGDGSAGMVEFNLDPIIDHHAPGTPVTHLVTTGLDISDLLTSQAEREDRLQAETAASRETERRLRGALDAMLDNVAITRGVRDDSGAIVDFEVEYANQRAATAAGRPPEELVGSRLRDLHAAWRTSEILERLVEVVATGEPFVAERLPYPGPTAGADGEAASGLWDVQVARLDDGFIAAYRDVTTIVRTEEAARLAQAVADRERTATEVLQGAALPAYLPTLPGVAIGVHYRPASVEIPIGGDWYDVVVPGDDRVVLVIADVAGHGPEAAGYMLQLRNVLRAIAVEQTDPAELLRRANEVAAALAVPDGPFATCCVATLDRDRTRLRWSVAGHIAPVVRHKGRPATWLQARAGCPLGVERGATFTTSEEVLGVGDRIVLFTDGLVETKTASLDEGMRRLLDGVDASKGMPAESAAEWLAANVSSGDDDVALITLDVT
jgi:serine phosphatase RsbU (regulator of sigma subunit)/PAS domain-containing protein